MKCLENGQDVDTIYLSADLLASLYKKYNYKPTKAGSGLNINSIITAAGKVRIRTIGSLKNFCYAGTETSFNLYSYHGFDSIFWNDEERLRIDNEFEKIFLGEGQ